MNSEFHPPPSYMTFCHFETMLLNSFAPQSSKGKKEGQYLPHCHKLRCLLTNAHARLVGDVVNLDKLHSVSESS